MEKSDKFLNLQGLVGAGEGSASQVALRVSRVTIGAWAKVSSVRINLGVNRGCRRTGSGQEVVTM